MTSVPDNVYPLRRRTRFGDVGEWVFDRVAEALAPLAMCPERCGTLRARVLATCSEKQRAAHTVRAAEGEWRTLVPGVTIKLLRTDQVAGNMTAFVRLEPGASLGGHTHSQDEECLVVEGEIFIGGHRLGAGDLHVAVAGTAHDMVTSPRGALLLVRAQTCPGA